MTDLWNVTLLTTYQQVHFFKHSLVKQRLSGTFWKYPMCIKSNTYTPQAWALYISIYVFTQIYVDTCDYCGWKQKWVLRGAGFSLALYAYSLSPLGSILFLTAYKKTITRATVRVVDHHCQRETENVCVKHCFMMLMFDIQGDVSAAAHFCQLGVCKT